MTKTIIFEIDESKKDSVIECLRNDGAVVRFVSPDWLTIDGLSPMSDKEIDGMMEYLKKRDCGNDRILHVKMAGCWWEDAVVNGLTDEKTHEKQMPGYHGGTIDWDIDAENGRILNWNDGSTAQVWYKVVDCFAYDYGDHHYGPDYVPEFMAIDDKGWGDYVRLTIDGNGFIKDWSAKKFHDYDSAYFGKKNGQKEK